MNPLTVSADTAAGLPARRPGRRWDFALALDRERDSRPLYLQIARSIVSDICRGRLKPGDGLPGARTLAQSLGVNRITVMTAYDELSAEGWVTIRPSTGVSVSDELPERPTGGVPVAPRTAIPAVASYDLPAAPIVEHAPEHLSKVMVFAGNSPDPRLLPVEPLARAYRRVLCKSGGQVLRYGVPEGSPRLRLALADMLSSTRGLAASKEQVFVTRGSQMALTLAARALIRPGDVVAVEALGYRHAWESFVQAGAKLVPIPVDREGLSVVALETLVRKRRIRAVYTTPHHQFPTTVTLAADRRMRLLDLAQANRIALIEDDYDHEFHYDGQPVLPLASLDRAGVVIYVGTLSKVLAPGLRIGYVVGPRNLLKCLAGYREFLDMQGDHAVEGAVAELLEEGEVQRHVRRVRKTYKRRRDLLVSLLREKLGGELRFEIPSGGIAIWVRTQQSIDVEKWAAHALVRGVAFQTARAFTFDRRSQPFARLGFAALNENELIEAVMRLRNSLNC